MPECLSQTTYSFREGSLLIVDEERRMAVTGAPQPRAVCSEKASSRWRVFTPALRLVQPYRRRKPSKRDATSSQLNLDLDDPKRLTASEEKKRAFDRFRFSLPPEVARAVEGFPSGQWPLLVLAVKYAAARDLAAHNPVLAYLLAHHFVRERFRAPEVTGFLKFKQQELVGLLELPDRPAVINILKKVHPPALTIAGSEALRGGLQDEVLRAQLGHMKVITAGVLSLMAIPQASACCTSKLFHEVAAAKDERYRGRTAAMLDEIWRMEEAMGEPFVPTRLQSRAQVARLHAESHQRFREWTHRPRRIRATRFPPHPPIPPARHIEPLTSVEALEEEGRTQDNCVASYAKKVSEGSTYIYRVLWPERATLSLVRDETGNWTRGELEIRGNCPASPRTARYVDEWLRHFRIGL